MSNTNKESFLKHYRVKVPAGGEVDKACAGEFFSCADVDGGNGSHFEMRWDSQPFFPFNVGLGFRMLPGEQFKKVTFKNSQASDLYVEFYAGSANFFDSRLNIVRGRAAPVMNAPTVLTPHSDTIAAGDTIDLTGEHPTFPNYIRKAHIITNLDTAVDLDILDENDALIDVVMYRETKLYEISAGIKIKNNGATPIVCRAFNVWYIVELPS